MKKIIAFVLNALAASLCAFAEKSCPDGVCEVPDSSTVASGRYAVYSPVGIGNIAPIKQAARLDSLDGKTIAVVGGSFMAYITHPEIKRLILLNYPRAKVILLNEIGSAGPWPAPGAGPFPAPAV
ncbi:MAG: hypothetical protein IJI37_07730, partial [Opitutales bacterium]|nr:hypothetical protein [Opitutales bacterium]